MHTSPEQTDRPDMTAIEKANIGSNAVSAALLYSPKREEKKEPMLVTPPHPEEAPDTD